MKDPPPSYPTCSFFRFDSSGNDPKTKSETGNPFAWVPLSLSPSAPFPRFRWERESQDRALSSLSPGHGTWFWFRDTVLPFDRMDGWLLYLIEASKSLPVPIVSSKGGEIS